MRTLILSLTVVVLAGCAGYPQRQRVPGRVTPVAWQRNQGVNPDAAKVQQVIAMQAKQARCKSELEARPGRDGTSPRDWKCKGPKQS